MFRYTGHANFIREVVTKVSNYGDLAGYEREYLRLRTVKEFNDVFDSSADEKLVELLSTVESQPEIYKRTIICSSKDKYQRRKGSCVNPHCFLIFQAFVNRKKIRGEYE